MPGTVSGNFGTRKRPATLDFGQIIAKVEWAVGPDILMVRILGMIRKPSTPTTGIVSLKAYTGDAFVTTIDIHDATLPVPVIEQPKINKAMVSHELVWNRAPKKGLSANETFNIYQALIFFNLGVIKKANDIQDLTYKVIVNFPASTRKQTPFTLYYAFINLFDAGWDYNREHPHTTGAVIDADGHIGVVGSPQFFSTAEQRDAFLGYNAGSLPPWIAHDEPAIQDLSDLFQWEIEAWTFRRRKEFPVDEDFQPTFSVSDEFFKHHEDTIADGAYIDITDLPARTVTIEANFKSLDFTMKKV